MNANAMIELSNFDEVVEMLSEKMMELDKRCNRYQTDIYLYVDEETNKGSLDEFVNVGGNSWLDDDHITIYSDKEHFDGSIDWAMQDINFTLDTLKETGITVPESVFEDGECDASELEAFLRKSNEAKDAIQLQFESSIDDNCSEYVYNANELISERCCSAPASPPQREKLEIER